MTEPHPIEPCQCGHERGDHMARLGQRGNYTPCCRCACAGFRKAQAPEPASRQDQIAERVQELLDAATQRHCTGGEEPETFIECHVCQRWDDHADDCWVPLLDAWLKTGSMTPFELHRAADPHCTCNDCIAWLANHQGKD